MTPEARPAAFSLEFGQNCAAELARYLARYPMTAAAKRREIKDFAQVAIRCYRANQEDWHPASRGPSAEEVQ